MMSMRALIEIKMATATRHFYTSHTSISSGSYYPNLQFFYGSSVFSVLNFLAKLAPFSEPIKLLEDSSPRIKPLDVSNFNALKAKTWIEEIL